MASDEAQGGLFDDPAAGAAAAGGFGPAAGHPEPDSATAAAAATAAAQLNQSEPLASRMRPRSLDEVVGHDKVLRAGGPLRRLIEGTGNSSVILYGPPGSGKTTIASLISHTTGRRFEALSALNAGVKEVRAVIDAARRRQLEGKQTVLFIDEVHRFSKTQQDALLAAVEHGVILLVAATTENPSFSVVSPLLSRSLIVQLTALEPAAIEALLRRALTSPFGLNGEVAATEAALKLIARLSAGDARRGLTALEAAAETTLAHFAAGEAPLLEAGTETGGEEVAGADPTGAQAGGEAGVADAEVAGAAPAHPRPGRPLITVAEVEGALDHAAVKYDRDGDQHYDVTSAFIKSIRGSDVDAALHYLARMLVAGEDPRFIARRLVIHASEDIGLADPTALQAAVAAAQAVALIGMPEAQLTLTQATIHLATAPKSNGVVAAIGAAMADFRAGKAGPVPTHLRDGHYAGAKQLGNAVGYSYPHDVPEGVVTQQYPPTELVGVDYYHPVQRGAERQLADRVEKLRAIIRGRRNPPSGPGGPAH